MVLPCPASLVFCAREEDKTWNNIVRKRNRNIRYQQESRPFINFSSYLSKICTCLRKLAQFLYLGDSRHKLLCIREGLRILYCNFLLLNNYFVEASFCKERQCCLLSASLAIQPWTLGIYA